MNGEMVGKRAVRTNWASRRTATQNNNNLEAMSTILSDEEKIGDYEKLYERIYNSTDSENTTVYLGNLGTPEQPRLITGIYFV